MNKDIGGNGIPAKLFKFLKPDAVKVLHQYVSKFKKLSSGHRTRKGQFSFQTLRKAMLQIVQVRLQKYVNREHPDVQAGFRKGRGTRDQIANIR